MSFLSRAAVRFRRLTFDCRVSVVLGLLSGATERLISTHWMPVTSVALVGVKTSALVRRLSTV